MKGKKMNQQKENKKYNKITVNFVVNLIDLIE